LGLCLLLLHPPAVQQMVGNTQVSGYLGHRLCRVAYQLHGFYFKPFRLPSSGLGAHAVLQLHHSPLWWGGCTIGASSTRIL
jgi:hypothetical protein